MYLNNYNKFAKLFGANNIVDEYEYDSDSDDITGCHTEDKDISLLFDTAEQAAKRKNYTAYKHELEDTLDITLTDNDWFGCIEATQDKFCSRVIVSFYPDYRSLTSIAKYSSPDYANANFSYSVPVSIGKALEVAGREDGTIDAEKLILNTYINLNKKDGTYLTKIKGKDTEPCIEILEQALNPDKGLGWVALNLLKASTNFKELTKLYGEDKILKSLKELLNNEN